MAVVPSLATLAVLVLISKILIFLENTKTFQFEIPITIRNIYLFENGGGGVGGER